MLTEYNWSPGTEAAARAIAKTDGWDFHEDAYSAIAIPVGRPWHYWCRAVAAIEAFQESKESIPRKPTRTTDRVFVLLKRGVVMHGYHTKLDEAKAELARTFEYYQQRQGIIFVRNITDGNDYGRIVVVHEGGETVIIQIIAIEHHQASQQLAAEELRAGQKARLGLT
jgi:hypothetical protein